MNSNISDDNGFEFLDIITLCSFMLQLQNMEQSANNFKRIEQKLDYIINKIDKENL